MTVLAATPISTCSTPLTVILTPPGTATTVTWSSPSPVSMTTRPFTSITVKVPLPRRGTDPSALSSTRPSPSVSAAWNARPTSPTHDARCRPMP